MTHPDTHWARFFDQFAGVITVFGDYVRVSMSCFKVVGDDEYDAHVVTVFTVRNVVQIIYHDRFRYAAERYKWDLVSEARRFVLHAHGDYLTAVAQVLRRLPPGVEARVRMF